MRSTHYQSVSERTAQILQESTVVAKAIARHQREATLQGRIEEVREMEALGSGVYSMVLKLTPPRQQTNAA